MSSAINLKTYLEYSHNLPPTQAEVGTADFFLPPGMQLPKKGLTFLYGYRDSQVILGHAIKRAHDRGRNLCMVEVEAEIGEWTVNKKSLEDLETSRFIAVPSRVKVDILDDIRDRWRDIAIKRNVEPDDFPRKASLNMHLLDDLMEEEPYKNLTAIAYPVITSVGQATFATIYHLDRIRSIKAISTIPIDVRLIDPVTGQPFTVQTSA